MLTPQRVVEDIESLESAGHSVGWRDALALNRAGIIASQSGIEFDSIWAARRVCVLHGVPLFEPCLYADKWLEECARLYSPSEYDFLRLVAWTNDGAAMDALLKGDFSAIDGTAAARLAKCITRAQVERIAAFLGRTDEPKLTSAEPSTTDVLEDITLGVVLMGASHYSDLGLTMADWISLPRGKAYALLRRAYKDSPAYKEQRAEAEIEYNTILDGIANGQG